MAAMTHFRFLLLEDHSTLGVSLMSEPLFLANWLLGRNVYAWSLVSIDGQPVRSSSGVMQAVDGMAENVPEQDPLFVVASFNGKSVTSNPTLLNLLRRRARHGGMLGGIETGSEALARAGLLDGYHAAVHWDNAGGFREMFPRVSVSNRSFEIDRHRVTSAGALANLHLMAALIGADHGDTVVREILRHLLVQPLDENAEFQGPETPTGRSVVTRRVHEAVSMMQDNIETPLTCPEIAAALDVSLRQLERNFIDTFGVTPKRYYLVLRLNHAHALLQQTDLSVTEIAVSAGFSSTEHFSRAYRAQFGETPSRDRRQVTWAPVAWSLDGTPEAPHATNTYSAKE
ncbi:MAG: GlxA family transcriptional regulator [Rhodospirillales bacterium]